MIELLLATQNRHKIIEIKEKFSSLSLITILTLEDYENLPEIIENGNTFYENALIKAKIISNFTGKMVLSDDSGLVVDGLDGRPGIFSARYGGEDLSDYEKNILILKEMTDIKNRSARFVASMVLYMPDGEFFSFSGESEGEISQSISGKNGFGYDPIFFLPGLNKNMADISLKEKNNISHRARALEKVFQKLEKIDRGATL